MAFAGAFSPTLPLPPSSNWVVPDVCTSLQDWDLDACNPPQSLQVAPHLSALKMPVNASDVALEEGSLVDAMAMMEKLQEASCLVAVLRGRLAGEDSSGLSPRLRPAMKRCLEARTCLPLGAPFTAVQQAAPLTYVEGLVRIEGDPILDALPVEETLGTVLMKFSEKVVQVQHIVLERASAEHSGAWCCKAFKYFIYAEDPNDAEPLRETLVLEGLIGGARLLPLLAERMSEDGQPTPRNLKVSLEDATVQRTSVSITYR
mmetsp:Transcript_53047/g.119318  ORF Transcript_53047/g.119318 Transcript_53047/m.119318 type:complete len:260 (+) Transcript_53047:48-827(+)